MSKDKNSSWRYQSVYIERDAGNDEKALEFSICEIYLDKDGKLETWTENSKMSPFGDTVEELLGDLQFMIDDVRKWKAVPFDSMQVGMSFEKTE